MDKNGTMKTFKPDFILAICCIAFVFGLSSCKKDNILYSLTGVWNHDTKTTTGLVRESYQFNGDSTVVYTRALYDTTNNALLGYSYKMAGRYGYDGITLKLIANDFFYPPNNLSYTTLDKLMVLVATPAVQNIELHINTGGTSFNIISGACPINANCIAASSSQLYLKQLPGIQ